MTIYEAKTRPYNLIDPKKAAGKISGSFIYAYPPDIPVIIPGERISEEHLGKIKDMSESGIVIKGLENSCIRGIIE